MKKTAFTITYDEEKLSALKIYLAQKGMDFDVVIISDIEHLYARHVPAGVRKFIDLKTKAARPPKEVKANG